MRTDDALHAAGAVAFARERLRFEPDEKKQIALDTGVSRALVNCTQSRQTCLDPGRNSAPPRERLRRALRCC